MTKRKCEDSKYIYFTCPKSITDYFEKLAREDLEDEGTEVNAMSLGRKRNDMIVRLLEWAIDRYEEIGT